jgi:hypothetical protein
MIKHKDRTYYGFDHKVVAENFGGNPKFIREFEIADRTWAVYFCDTPDLTKGHTPYMMLGRFVTGLSGDSQIWVSGRTVEEMETLRWQQGILCQSCNTVLYSMGHHDFHVCGCENNTCVDGGRAYLRTLAADLSKTRVVTIDLLTSETFDSETGEIYIMRDNK